MESLSVPTLRALYKNYVNWVSTHPERTTDLEASIKWMSYFLAGILHMDLKLQRAINRYFVRTCRSYQQLDIVVRAYIFHVQFYDVI